MVNIWPQLIIMIRSKKMYVWEFSAKLVNDKNQEQYQKYRIEFKDSVSSGKSTVVFNGTTLLYKSKMYILLLF